jgi:signal transduction histidine kinase
MIFEKFHQAGDASNRPAGTGLGLPICRQIVEHFGGRIGLRDDIGQGASFEFWLPWPVAGMPGQRPDPRQDQRRTHGRDEPHGDAQ